MTLSSGLRALSLLAETAPVLLADFAGAAGLTRRQAQRLIDLYIADGCAVRIAHSDYVMLTPAGMALMPATNPVGAILSLSMPVVAELGRLFGTMVSLSMATDAGMTIWLTSADPGNFAAADLRPGRLHALFDSVSGLIHLAHCPPAWRLALALRQRAGANIEMTRLDDFADSIRETGHGLAVLGRNAGALAVPVMIDARCVAVLAVHFAGHVMASDPVALFRPGLDAAADRIAADVQQHYPPHILPGLLGLPPMPAPADLAAH